MRWVIYAQGLNMIKDTKPKPLSKYCSVDLDKSQG